jgi:hypothetical protein
MWRAVLNGFYSNSWKEAVRVKQEKAPRLVVNHYCGFKIKTTGESLTNNLLHWSPNKKKHDKLDWSFNYSLIIQ